MLPPARGFEYTAASPALPRAGTAPERDLCQDLCQGPVSAGWEHPWAARTPRAPWLGGQQAELHSTLFLKPPGLFVAALAPGTATSALALPPPPSANLEVHRGQ